MTRPSELDEEWMHDARSVLLSLESVLRWPIRHPDEGSYESACKTAYGGICTLLGIDPRPLLPDWPGTPELAPPGVVAEPTEEAEA